MNSSNAVYGTGGRGRVFRACLSRSELGTSWAELSNSPIRFRGIRCTSLRSAVVVLVFRPPDDAQYLACVAWLLSGIGIGHCDKRIPV